jgi:hypothetical protein
MIFTVHELMSLHQRAWYLRVRRYHLLDRANKHVAVVISYHLGSITNKNLDLKEKSKRSLKEVGLLLN